MLPEPLGLNANQWQFLKHPDEYVEVSKCSDRPLVLESTRRQFRTARDILARLNGSCGEESRRGVLLADDVGLGKTPVAALVAWVVASAGDASRRVRILAPNKVMRRRWVEELRSHVLPLQKCASSLDVNEMRVKDGGGKLFAGRIQVVTHYDAVMGAVLDCDLLIVDEAHRAKRDQSKFARKLKQTKKLTKQRILILTATPFGIHLAELNRMLTLIGGGTAHRAVNAYSRALDDLYSENVAGDSEVMAKRLAEKAKAAVVALSPFVIRHGIEDLPCERKSFGVSADWNIDVPAAKPEELKLLMRMDRALRVARDGSTELSKATTDSRFHVSWRYFDSKLEDLRIKVPLLAESAAVVVENQLKSIKRLRDKVGVHPKITAIADTVKSVIEQGEKVVLFCDYHKTAEELTLHLASKLPKMALPQSPGRSIWKKAWVEVLDAAGYECRDETLRIFIEWLCADLIRSQTWNWLRAASASASKSNLADALKKTNARPPHGWETVADAAQRLFDVLSKSTSSRGVLKKAAAEDRLELLPGANGAARVLGVCGDRKEESLFLHNRQLDTVLSIFNSPFGPDVLVVTDKLSEGIDLHRYCRHLIHYELDPSPIRTVQRNGRLRRVNSWAAISGLPILYSYPAFRGTRDEKLVQIMKKRINKFSLLPGGVRKINIDEVGEEEERRNKVIERAREQLEKLRGKLAAKEPGTPFTN